MVKNPHICILMSDVTGIIITYSTKKVIIRTYRLHENHYISIDIADTSKINTNHLRKGIT